MNEPVPVKVKTLAHYDSSFALPSYETRGAAGADVRACLEEQDRARGFTIAAGTRALIPTGLSMEIPPGHEVQVRPRSGLSLKTNLLVVNSPGTIDSDYRGEVKIILGNMGDEPHVIKHGERIAQLVLAPVTQAQYIISEGDLSSSDRGTGGFGSTGTK